MSSSERRRSIPDQPRLYELPSGGFEIAYHLGRRRRFHVCGEICGLGRQGLKNADEEIQDLRARGLLRGEPTRLAEIVEASREHEQQRAAGGLIQVGTLEGYERALSRVMRLLDPPGRDRLARDVFPHTVAGLARRLRAQGTPDTTLQLNLSALNLVFEHAVSTDQLGYNPVSEYRAAKTNGGSVTRDTRDTSVTTPSAKASEHARVTRVTRVTHRDHTRARTRT